MITPMTQNNIVFINRIGNGRGECCSHMRCNTDRDNVEKSFSVSKTGYLPRIMDLNIVHVDLREIP